MLVRMGSAPARRFVVVTGGSRGIGREVVARFVGQGDDVLALGRDEAALAQLAVEYGERVSTSPCDVSSEDDVRAAFADLPEVDVLVNNAGVAEGAPLHRTTLEAWQRQMAVNATGAFLCTREVIAGMRSRGSGAIVTVASTAGLAGAPYTGAYSASKHAAVGLMRAAAAELAGSGATANAVCPTYVDTDMTKNTIERIAERTGRSRQESAAVVVEQTALGRLLGADEVAEAVVWLASPAAVAINGQTLVIDGGGLQA
jgi:NAD(P)-dependent dehydrogenase (short-subunit alcohol dehydrogenase family)